MKSLLTPSFRPHHFLCMLGFQGKGYSASFIKNMQSIHTHVNTYPHTVIHISFQKTDDICAPCPHRTAQTCEKEPFIRALDARHTRALHLHNVTSLTWLQAVTRIKAYMTLDVFQTTCHGCPWQSMGMCETALKQVANTKQRLSALPPMPACSTMQNI